MPCSEFTGPVDAPCYLCGSPYSQHAKVIRAVCAHYRGQPAGGMCLDCGYPASEHRAFAGSIVTGSIQAGEVAAPEKETYWLGTGTIQPLRLNSPVRKSYSRSGISFEYTQTIEHVSVVKLLRKAIIDCDMHAVLELHKHITDIKGG